MKVEGPGKSQSASKSKKSSGSSSGVDFSRYISTGEDSSTPVSTAQSISQIDALLAVQGAEDPTERAARSRMQARSEKILDELEKVRMAMLSGTLTLGHMVEIADVIASHRERVQDPVLTDIMDEIDLRAQVELAKMKMAIKA